MFNKAKFKNSIIRNLKILYGKNLEEAIDYEIFNAVSTAIMEAINDDWRATTKLYQRGKMAYYFSAEYLMGRTFGNNLINLGIYEDVSEVLQELNININEVEEKEEDAGLGNGGLGRLAACFLESAATMKLPLMGYGIRYSHGLFKQKIEKGYQKEEEDNWLKYGDPWSIRKAEESVVVELAGKRIKAVPYDTPIIGYRTKNINTLRLWQAEPIKDFDYTLFNDQKHVEALQEKIEAENISRILYPNDSNEEGKLLRIKQQYFLVSSSLQDILKKDNNINPAIQLNDTHPVLAIPEYIRLVTKNNGLSFEEALENAKKIFSYTNHTIMAEALEQWDISLFNKLFPSILDIINIIDRKLVEELRYRNYPQEKIDSMKIVGNNRVRMANLAIYVCHATNGVAELHTNILKNQELKNWYNLYPERFQNKTNGITPRRWLRLANKELSSLITEIIGDESWVTNLSKLKELEKYSEDERVLNRFMEIKLEKKKQLAAYIKETEGIDINPYSIFDIQVKRLHEYKRQLLNALHILDLYFRLKENPNMDIHPVTYIIGGKAFPSYMRAKGIIKVINEIARIVNSDEETNKKLKVVFVSNYRVSYAEKLVTAADVSEQISTAGKEASGTGNMKFMLNGTPTLGTYDGANVEIVREAGENNNFICGLRVESINHMRNNYSSRYFYENQQDLKRVVDALINGTLKEEGTNYFKSLYDSLIYENDQYFVLADFQSYKNTQQVVNTVYKNKIEWAKKCWLNLCNAGNFSSDRTINEYARDIWNIQSKEL